MFYTKNLDQIRIEETELLLEYNSTNLKRIPINEIKKVFVSVKKIPFQYEVMYILFGGIYIGLNFSFYPIGLYFWLVSGTYLIGEYIIHSYKSCSLILELENNRIIYPFIPYKLKYQLVNKINEIKFRLAA